jgi:hypothetical protein
VLARSLSAPTADAFPLFNSHTARALALALDLALDHLDSSFRSRREVLKFGYASVATVKHHFKKVNQLLTQHFKVRLSRLAHLRLLRT